jgi:hypothetical protein
VRQSTSLVSSPLLEASLLFYRVALPLSRTTLNYAAGIIATTGSRPVVLAEAEPRPADVVRGYLRKGEKFAELAANSRPAQPRPGDMSTRPPPPRGPGRGVCARRSGPRRKPVAPSDPRRDAHPHRPGRGGTVRSPPASTDEPAGHRLPWRRRPVSIRGAVLIGP